MRHSLARGRVGLRAGIAAGHPATAEAGIEILAAGGSAADAAVAAGLASCVAETVMTGLLGGGHAIYWDGGRAWSLDCFVTVPSGSGADLVALEVPFGTELVHYAIGPGSFAVPGLPAGLEELWRRFGRLPWPRLVEPALRLARDGVPMPPAHAACLAMLAPVYTLTKAGRAIYAPRGRPLRAGERLEQPGLARALEILAAEGARGVYEGPIAETLLAGAVEGVAVTRQDLSRYEPRWGEPVSVDYAATRFLTRGDLSGVPETLPRLPALRGLGEADRVRALVGVLGEAGPDAHTTNLVVADADGNACVLTSSLGLGTGDFLPPYDLQLNSMLGEKELIRGPLRPGRRMPSMMAPSIALAGDGSPVLAIGAAGGTRLRTALVGVVAGVLDESLEVEHAIARPRFHPTSSTVNAEPGVDESALAALESDGWSVRRWPAPHHYFGGVSAITPTGAAGDPRRSGSSRLLA